MILAKFCDLIKDCQDFLTLEQKLMCLVAAEACRQYAKILEAIDVELVKELKRREMWKSCAGTGVQCLPCLVPLLSPDTLSESREEKHIIR